MDCKKNLVYLDLYRGNTIVHPLVGQHNGCKVSIQGGNPARPSRPGRKVNDILACLGVECGEARSVGNRNPYSLVRAIFDALQKHRGLQELSRATGRRLISVSKARQLGI